MLSGGSASSFMSGARLSNKEESGAACGSSAGGGTDAGGEAGEGGNRSKRRSRGPVMAAKRKAEGGGEAEGGGKYKDSVNLPVTSFGMRANAVVREPEIQKRWEDEQIMKRIRDACSGDVFTLHDGPPYANGDLHIGHALNKILKDFINRYQILRGRRVKFVPGWDCHGLPIELKVLQSMDSEARRNLTAIKLRKKAAQFARKTVDSQRKSFKRYGVWGEWEEPYLTLSPKYEAAQMGVFAQMFLKGHIYRGRKPVHWSPSSRTALAEAELEYPEGHVSRSVYVAFPVTELSSQLPAEARECLPAGLGLGIWTTTPWTMPGNAAVAVNDKLSYSIVEVGKSTTTPPGEEGNPEKEDAGPEVEKAAVFGKGKRNVGQALRGVPASEASSEGGASNSFMRFLIVATDLVPSLEAKFGRRLGVVCSFAGSALTDTRYRHPLEGRECPVVVGGDYITTESGTGLVHTAPGHGQEDYQTGLKYNLPLISPVDDAGNFTEDAGQFAGLNVLGDGNVAVMKALDEGGLLLLEEAYEHKYPYDWRSKKPTIFRATNQWFASVDGFREDALRAISSVKWIPPQGEKRITGMTVGRSDWCISRQRSWGVPIPVFFHTESGDALMTQETLAHVQQIVAEKGSDAWFEMSVEDLLPPSLKAEAEFYVKGTDTMDVWFDSGSSWAAVLEGEQAGAALSFPADLYLEGSDQHRGWFQSSLLTCVASSGIAPYKAVLTHGFVLDERGFKMSKSVGNVVDPMLVIAGGKNQKENPAYGADVLRLWVASVDYSGDVLIGPSILRQLSDIYRKLRGTVRFLLGNLFDYNAEKEVPYEELPMVDRYALHRLSSVMNDVVESYDKFEFYRFFQAIQRFAVVDLSNFYFDVCKDRLYVGGSSSFTRRASQTVLAAQLRALLACLAPVLPHLSEDAWENLPPGLLPAWGFETGGGSRTGPRTTPEPRRPTSVFEAKWPEPAADACGLPQDSLHFWESLLTLRAEVNKVMEQARVGKLIGANLDAKVFLASDDAQLVARFQEMTSEEAGVDHLRYLFLSSQVDVLPDIDSSAELKLQFSNKFELEGYSGDLWVGVGRADGCKCERCWNFSIKVGTFDAHPTLCERCFEVVEKAPIQTPVAV